MNDAENELKERLRPMPDAKRLAVAIYGESVAAYRYGELAAKAVSEEHRRIFLEMQDEETEHERLLRALAEKLCPGADFVLNAEDKDLVIVGSRMLDIGDAASFRRAMQFLHDTEKRTGTFYRVLHELMPEGELGSFLSEMADECFEHGESLLGIAPPSS